VEEEDEEDDDEEDDDEEDDDDEEEDDEDEKKKKKKKKIYYYIYQILIGIQYHSKHLYYHTNLVYCNTFQKDKHIHDIYHIDYLY